MEKPSLGLVYTKTAALPLWEDITSSWKKVAPVWMGGDPAKPDAPTTPPPPPVQKAVQPDAPASAAATPAQKKPSSRADRQKKLRDLYTSPEWRQREEARLAEEKRTSDYVSGEVARQRKQTPEAGVKRDWAGEQKRRSDQGAWAWNSSRGLVSGKNQPSGLSIPNFASSGGYAGFGNMRNANGNAKLPSAFAAAVPGMTRTDFIAGTNRFLDNQQLEGQGAAGMGLEEFDRYMGRYYPGQQQASRERYAKPQIQWAEGSPMYQTQSKTPGKTPIQWQPTTYEQAARMGVLDGDRLKTPGTAIQPPAMRSYGGGVSASLTPEQQANLAANGGWSPQKKQTARGLGADTNQAGVSNVVGAGASTENAMPTRLGTAAAPTPPVKSPQPATKPPADKMRLGVE